MARRKPVAGGFFLFAAITIGFVWGAARAQAMQGVLIGTGVGIAIAVALWLADRRR